MTELSRSEKKIVSIPSIRVDEQLRLDLQRLADIEGVSESEMARIAISRMIDAEWAKFEELTTIFAGRDRRRNNYRALQCDENGENL